MLRLYCERGIYDLVEALFFRNRYPDRFSVLRSALLVQGVKPSVRIVERIRKVLHFFLVVVADKDCESFVFLSVLRLSLNEAREE